MKQRILHVVFAGVLVLLMPARVLGDRSVTLVWESGFDDDVAGYNVYYGTESRFYTHSISVGIEGNATVAGLKKGVTYFFAVTAYNNSGLQSPYSAEVSHEISSSSADTYCGLFSDELRVGRQSAGAFTVSINARGTCTGKLRIGSARYAFSGRVNSLLNGLSLRCAKKDAPVLRLDLGPGAETDELVGRVTDGQWTARLAAFRSSSSFRPQPGAVSGSRLYTLILPGDTNNPAAPAGHGFARVRVTQGGVIYLAGRLANGEPATASASESRSGHWPVYVSLQSGNEIVMGWMAFTNQAAEDLAGRLVWIQQADVAGSGYSGGFTNEFLAVGSTFLLSTRANTPWETARGLVVFSGGNLGSTFSKPVTIGNGAMNGAGIVGTFSPANGQFAGRIIDPATGQRLVFKGAVLQGRKEGYGFLLMGNRSSSVSIIP